MKTENQDSEQRQHDGFGAGCTDHCRPQRLREQTQGWFLARRRSGSSRSGQWTGGLVAWARGILPRCWRRGVPSPRGERWLFLGLHRLVLPVSIGLRGSVLRPLLTPAPPEPAFAGPFLAFRQALLLGAATARRPSVQVSPDKNVICRCTSSPFTYVTIWERLCGVVPTRLATPALYDVSVRSLVALVPASFPRSVARPQLPSPCTLSIGAIIWSADLLETPSLVHGTLTR